MSTPPEGITPTQVREAIQQLHDHFAQIPHGDLMRLPDPLRQLSWDVQMVVRDQAFSRSWSLGGQTGGGWGGGEPSYSATPGEVPPEWEGLVRVLDHFAPDFPFLGWRRLMMKAAESAKTDRSGDYYGNWTDTRTEQIPLDAVCAELSTHLTRVRGQLPALPPLSVPKRKATKGRQPGR